MNLQLRPRTLVAALVLALAAAAAYSPTGQQRPPDYRPPTFAPSYATAGPRIAIDASHHEMHTLDGGYAAFAALAAADGFRVAPATLAADGRPIDADVLVVANARAAGEAEDPLDTARSAFAANEVQSLAAWVDGGGSLLLVADHWPFGGYSRALASAFGVAMSGGYVNDSGQTEAGADEGVLRFTRTGDGLGEHWITAPLDSVRTFTGQALGAPAGTCLLRFSPQARLDEVVSAVRGHMQVRDAGSAAGMCQAVALRYGRGRVVVLGEAAMITAQISGDGVPFGMQLPGADNEQFTLQVLRWLAGADACRRGGTGVAGCKEGVR
jgi:hypothetical protein